MLEVGVIIVEDWGYGVPIKWAIEKQDDYWAEKVFKQDMPDKIIFAEHEPVYTAGLSCAINSYLIKQCFKKEIWELPAPVEIMRRGGLVTYQGPGMLSVYCVFNLQNISIRGFENMLLGAAENFFDAYGIKTSYRPDNPGLYIGKEKKIVSIGLQISRGVTRYGMAVSLDPEKKYLEPLIPCGLKNMRMTSLAEELGVINFSESEKSAIKKMLETGLLTFLEKLKTLR